MGSRAGQPLTTFQVVGRIAYGCTLGCLCLVAEERRRRLAFAQKLVDNGRRLQAYKTYKTPPPIETFYLGEEWDTNKPNLPPEALEADSLRPEKRVLSNREWRARPRVVKRSSKQRISSTDGVQTGSSKDAGQTNVGAYDAKYLHVETFLRTEQPTQAIHTPYRKVYRRESTPEGEIQLKEMSADSLVMESKLQDIRSENIVSTLTNHNATQSLENERPFRTRHAAHLDDVVAQHVLDCFKEEKSEWDSRAIRELVAYFGHDQPRFFSQKMRVAIKTATRRATDVKAELSDRVLSLHQLAMKPTLGATAFHRLDTFSDRRQSDHDAEFNSQFSLAKRMSDNLKRKEPQNALFEFFDLCEHVGGPLHDFTKSVIWELVKIYKSLEIHSIVADIQLKTIAYLKECTFVYEDYTWLLRNEPGTTVVEFWTSVFQNLFMLSNISAAQNCRFLTTCLNWLTDENQSTQAISILSNVLRVVDVGRSDEAIQLAKSIHEHAVERGRENDALLISSWIEGRLVPHEPDPGCEDSEQQTQSLPQKHSIPLAKFGEEYGNKAIILPQIGGTVERCGRETFHGQSDIDLFAVPNDENLTVGANEIYGSPQPISSGNPHQQELAQEESPVVNGIVDPLRRDLELFEAAMEAMPLENAKNLTLQSNDGPVRVNEQRIKQNFSYLRRGSEQIQLSDLEKTVIKHYNRGELKKILDLENHHRHLMRSQVPAIPAIVYRAFATIGPVIEAKGYIGKLAHTHTPQLGTFITRSHSYLLYRCWRETRNFNLTRDLFASFAMLGYERSISRKLFNEMILACVEAGELKHAQLYVKLMTEDALLRPNLETWSHLMLARAREGDWTDIERLFHTVRELKLIPAKDHTSRNCLNRVFVEFCRQNNADDVLSFLTRILDRFELPVTKTINYRVVENFMREERLDLLQQWLSFLGDRNTAALVSQEAVVQVFHRLCGSPKFKFHPNLPQISFQDVSGAVDGAKLLMDKMNAFLGPAGQAGITLQTKGTESNAEDKRRVLERHLLHARSRRDHREVVERYKIALRDGFKVEQVDLDLAVNSSITSNKGRLDEAVELVENAKATGINVERVESTVRIHKMQRVPLTDDQAYKEVFGFYSRVDEPHVKLHHHVTIAAAHNLLRNGRPNSALRLMKDVSDSEWGKRLPFGIAAMTLTLRILLSIAHIPGIEWVSQHVLERNMRIDRKFMDTLKSGMRVTPNMERRYVRRTSPLRDPSHQMPRPLLGTDRVRQMRVVLEKYIALCKQRRNKQREDTVAFANGMSNLFGQPDVPLEIQAPTQETKMVTTSEHNGISLEHVAPVEAPVAKAFAGSNRCFVDGPRTATIADSSPHVGGDLVNNKNSAMDLNDEYGTLPVEAAAMV